jgi:hypothetical protein
MSNIMAVLLNGVAQLEYDRGEALPSHQAVYLDKMDLKMDEGILAGENLIQNPDMQQRAQFVAGNLAHAILDNNESQSSALCSYLAMRLPDLKQVKIKKIETEISIELVFDEDYKKQVAVQFIH